MGSTSTTALVAAPILSTPDAHIFDSYDPAAPPVHSKLSDEALYIRYQIEWTVSEIRKRNWRRLALQFPDHMLPDAPRVYELLRDDLRSLPREEPANVPEGKVATGVEQLEHEVGNIRISTFPERSDNTPVAHQHSLVSDEKIYILGDTSYGACCVDEIAAEHVSADVVIHYGRACLSPTARLPVLHVFTIQPLDVENLTESFESSYPDKDAKILIVADVTFSSYVPTISSALAEKGYHSLFATEVVHNPSSLIPNRTVPISDTVQTDDETTLSEWHLFYVSIPPSSLLLTLTSRVASIRYYSTNQSGVTAAQRMALAHPMPLLRRRYALLTRLRTASIIGILINTLSASSTLPLLAHLRSIIAAAGKKAYTVVVGKVNAAKLANFAEVDGWVVVGCWESSLLEDDEGKGGSGWWKPCVTPWELEAALGPEGGGMAGWRADLESILEKAAQDTHGANDQANLPETDGGLEGEGLENVDAGPLADEEESEPPQFDLRTGRYVSGSRPMRTTKATSAAAGTKPTSALIKRAKGEVAMINGQASPGAAFLREKRTWRGLGSDFEISYEDQEGGLIEEGRSGIARGYNQETQNK